MKEQLGWVFVVKKDLSFIINGVSWGGLDDWIEILIMLNHIFLVCILLLMYAIWDN